MKMLMHQVKNWGPGAVAIGHEQEENHPYNMVLGEMLSFELKFPRHCQSFLKVADKVKHQGGDALEVLHDKAWRVVIRPTEVAIEYEFDDMGDDWKAVFPLEQVCRAVKGWMQFLQMPESSERRLIVDLDAD
jgi:hypothetical protein